jgi:undecaprenyl-diphosphatase
MMIDPVQAILLGIVEGLTEFLPVSSTGHLILVSSLFGLQGDAVDTFDVIIQGGALGAVVWLYRARVVSMWRGFSQGDAVGRKLFRNLVVSFLPSAIVGLLLHRAIKTALFRAEAVVIALAIGGALMIVVDRWLRHRAQALAKTLESMTIAQALLIGLAQCLSLWPGTSRAMVTIVAALLLGFPGPAAAEYSFLLALPTLGAATLFDAISGGMELLRTAGALSIACGFISAAVVAALAIRGFVKYLMRQGLAIFGWYRLALAALVWLVLKQT